jgi:molecular chaperone GrpE (heat shock protein)
MTSSHLLDAWREMTRGVAVRTVDTRDAAPPRELAALLEVNAALDDAIVAAFAQADLQWIAQVNHLAKATRHLNDAAGLEEIAPHLTPVNAAEHEIVGSVERDARAAGLIVDLRRRGFRCGGVVVRRAQVIVARVQALGSGAPGLLS